MVALKKANSPTLMVRIQTTTKIMEGSMAISQRIKIRNSIWPSYSWSSYISKRVKISYWGATCKTMFTAARHIVAKPRKQHAYPMDRENVVSIHNGLLLGSEEGLIGDICRKMDTLGKYNVN